MGVVSKTGGAIKKGVGWWVRGWTEPARTMLPRETRERFGLLRQFIALFAETFGRWRKRKRDEGRIRMSYDEMLFAWGVMPHEVPATMRALRNGRWLAIILSLVAFGLGLWQLARADWHGGVSLALMFMISANGAVMSWKLSCLAHKRYEEFFVWMGFRRQTHQ